MIDFVVSQWEALQSLRSGLWGGMGDGRRKVEEAGGRERVVLNLAYKMKKYEFFNKNKTSIGLFPLISHYLVHS